MAALCSYCESSLVCTVTNSRWNWEAEAM